MTHTITCISFGPDRGGSRVSSPVAVATLGPRPITDSGLRVADGDRLTLPEVLGSKLVVYDRVLPDPCSLPWTGVWETSRGPESERTEKDDEGPPPQSGALRLPWSRSDK